MFPRLILAAALVSAGACHSVSLRSPISSSTNGPPSTFVGTTTDMRMTRVIDVRDGVTRAQAFRAASDFLTQKYAVDVSDPRAGYIMTPWQNSLVRGGAPDLRYRTRLIIRIGEDGKQASIRNEANWQHGDEWDVGYDSQMLEDVVVDLRGRIGKKS
jgi:hypothetical protein